MQRFLDVLDAEGFAALARGAGLLLALALGIAARLVLPEDEKKYARTPLLFLGVYVLSLLLRLTLPDHWGAARPLALLGLFFLLCSIGRSGFLLVVHAALARRLAFPVPKIVQDIIQIAVYVGALLITLRAAGVEPGSLLATSALLTAVVGLSLQDTLGNLFAGLAIQAQRPFEIGDWIQFDDKTEHIGRVVEINWRATRIVTLDHVEVTVPNGILAKAPIRNYTKPTPIARRTVHVVAPYLAVPGNVRKLLVEPLFAVGGVLRTPEPNVIVTEFSERGVEYAVRFFIEDFDRREVITAQARERIWYALRRAGLEIPLPGRRIDLREVSPAVLEQEREARSLAREASLATVDFLRLLPDDARQKLARLAESRLYSEDEAIIRQGELGDELFIVESGEVSVVHERPDGRVVELATLGPGKFFGEMSLMTGEPRRATVRAVTESEVLVVGKRAFQEILASNAELLHQISEVLAARDEKRDEKIDEQSDNSGERQASVQTERGRLLLQRIRHFFSL